jgi:hypothetical protein
MGELGMQFLEAARRRGASLFRQLPTERTVLYSGVIAGSATSIGTWAANAGNAVGRHLFDFLVPLGFYKLIVSGDPRRATVIQDFVAITRPSEVSAFQDPTNPSCLLLHFDNGWKIRLRVHTAASRIALDDRQLSLKFDARRIDGHVREFTIDRFE